MVASVHLLEYRRRAFSPPRRLVGRVEGLRFWRALNIGGDFGWFRQHPGRWGLYRRLKPDFRRWAFYGVWEDDAALDAFHACSPVAESWGDNCVQALHLWLAPIRIRGPWLGMRALDGAPKAFGHDGPVAFLARLDLSLRGTWAMWASAAPHLLHYLPGGEELLLGLPLVDRPYVQPVSFSVWRSAHSAERFAFANDGHRAAVARVHKAQGDAIGRFSVGQFDPYRCEGTWNGRNPLAGRINVR
jgi:hypothetical protein